MQGSVVYNLFFAAAVCVVCAVFVSSSAVALRERQEYNAAIDKQRNVLAVSGMVGDDEKLAPEEVERRFTAIEQIIVDLGTGEEVSGIDPSTFDQRRASRDPATSTAAPPILDDGPTRLNAGSSIASVAARTTGMYSGRQPAITEFAATLPTVISRRRSGSSPTTSPEGRPDRSMNSPTRSSVGGTTGSPSVQPNS